MHVITLNEDMLQCLFQMAECFEIYGGVGNGEFSEYGSLDRFCETVEHHTGFHPLRREEKPS